LLEKGITASVTVHCADFILANAHQLEQPQSDFLRVEKTTERFDLVIANPPYLKISKDDPRARAAKSVVHGQPNIYGLFMAVGAALLKHCGDFIFITPRSFASGPYFRLFREVFFSTVRPLRAHVFTSRREAFSRDEVLQENVILHARVEDGWAKKRKAHVIELSASAGSRDLATVKTRNTPLTHVLSPDDKAHVFKLPASTDEEGSIGMFNYKIAQKQTNQVPYLIQNRAHIYFDLNPAIITNTVFHNVKDNTTAISESSKGNIVATLYPNPASNSFVMKLNVLKAGQSYTMQLFTGTGALVHEVGNIKTVENTVDVSTLASGLYYYRVLTTDGKTAAGRFVKE
jgi:hypothetical protein